MNARTPIAIPRSVRALTWLLYSDVRLATLRMWEGQADRRQLRCDSDAPRICSLQALAARLRLL